MTNPNLLLELIRRQDPLRFPEATGGGQNLPPTSASSADLSEYGIAPDPELERQKQTIWEKINRGPRERAQEIEDEYWRRTYGLTPKSGKGRRALASIGEMLRGIGGGAKYVGPRDAAIQQAMEEYKTEIGPLQRESAVLSAQEKARNAEQIAMTSKRNQDALKYLSLQINGARTAADVEKIKAETSRLYNLMPWQVEQLIASNELVRTKARGLSQEQSYLDKFGGVKLPGNSPLGEATALNALMGQPGSETGGVSPGLLKALQFGTDRRVAEKLASQRPGGAGGVSTSYGEQVVLGHDPVTGEATFNKIPTSRTTVRGGTAPMDFSKSMANFRQRYSEAEAAFTGQPSAEIPTGTGEVIRPEAPQMAFKGGQYQRQTGISPSYLKELSAELGVPEDKMSAFSTKRFSDRGSPLGIYRTTDPKITATKELHQSMLRLQHSVLEPFMDDKLKDITGIIDGSIGSKFRDVSRKMSGAEAEFLNANMGVVAKIVFDITGKAFTQRELETYMKALPANTNSDLTILHKVLAMKTALDLRRTAAILNLSPSELERVYDTASGQKLLKTPQVAAMRMEAIRRSVRATKVPGKTPVTKESLAKQKSLVKNLLSPEFRQRLWREAIKEAGIRDIYPIE